MDSVDACILNVQQNILSLCFVNLYTDKENTDMSQLLFETNTKNLNWEGIL